MRTNLIFVLFSSLLISGCFDTNQNSSASREQYRLAPMPQFTAAITDSSLRASSNSQRALKFPIIDPVNTTKDGLKFDLLYSSDNSVGDASISTGWSHTYSINLTNETNMSSVSVKSSLFETPKAACESGWEEVKHNYQYGLIENGVASYDSVSGLCQIKDGDKLLSQTLIWNSNDVADGDVMRIIFPNGKILVFKQSPDNGSKWVAINNSKFTLTKSDSGWKFKDHYDQVINFNNKGQVSEVIEEGESTVFEYGGAGEEKLIAISKPSSNQRIEFEYSGEKLLSITNAASNDGITLFFDEDGKLDYLDRAGVNQTSFFYNEKNIISSQENDSPEVTYTTNYTFDDFGRFINQKSVVTPKTGGTSSPIQGSTNRSLQRAATTDSSLVSIVDEVGAEVVTEEVPVEENYTIIDNIDPVTEMNIRYDANGNQIVEVDGEEALIEETVINGNEVVLSKETATDKMVFSYDDQGNIVKADRFEKVAAPTKSIGSSTWQQSFSARWNYDDNKNVVTADLLTPSETSTRKTGQEFESVFKVEYLYEDSRFNKPTLIKNNNQINMFEFDSDGKITRTTKAVLNKSSPVTFQNGIRGLNSKSLRALPLDSYRSEVLTYDELGRVISIEDAENNEITRLRYSESGQLVSSVDPQGVVHTRNILTESQSRQNNQTRATAGYVKNSGIFSVGTYLPTNKASILVGGFGDGGNPKHIVSEYRNRWRRVPNTQYLGWNVVDWHAFTQEEFSLFKNKANTFMLGHSYGGDSALAYGEVRPVDTIVAIDPVGWQMERGTKATNWINVTADPGPMMRIVWVRFRICRCGCCGFSRSIYGYYPLRIVTWNMSDFIALFGGKYHTYFSQARRYASVDYRVRAHHDDFRKMVNVVKANISGLNLISP